MEPSPATEVRATFTQPDGTSCVLTWTGLPGEPFEAVFERVAVFIRNGLGIAPAPPTDAVKHALLVQAVKDAVALADGNAPAKPKPKPKVKK